MIIKILFHSLMKNKMLYQEQKYFDFYSTLIKIPDNVKQPKVKNSLVVFILKIKYIFLLLIHLLNQPLIHILSKNHINGKCPCK